MHPGPERKDPSQSVRPAGQRLKGKEEEEEGFHTHFDDEGENELGLGRFDGERDDWKGSLLGADWLLVLVVWSERTNFRVEERASEMKANVAWPQFYTLRI